MPGFMRVMLIALTLLLMGARDLPRPCIGDGAGNACAVSTCQCTALCSCRSVCGVDSPDSGEACHLHASDSSMAGIGHVTLPEPPSPTLLLVAPELIFAHVAPTRLRDATRHLPAPCLLPPDPPPRIQA